MSKNEFINILEDTHCISILSEENNEVLGLCMAKYKGSFKSFSTKR
ncbi:MAG: hypothetical protein ACLTYB_03675 [Clostridium paraputrificum]